MKTIVVTYYCRGNLGDDLFVKLLTDYFNDCKIKLMINPRFVPQGLGLHVKPSALSVMDAVFAKLSQTPISRNRLFRRMQAFNTTLIEEMKARCDASVTIGGSLFQHKTYLPKDTDFRSLDELDFTTSEPPQFEINSQLQNNSNSILIGANLGPAYSEDYWKIIRYEISKYNHVCLRDYASYSMVQDLPHVQYAPDVIFMTPQPATSTKGENVVFSVIDIEKISTNDPVIAEAYYLLMADTANHFIRKNIPVTFISFCQREGDEYAINKVLSMLEDHTNVKTIFYKNKINEVLQAFADSTYVVGTRFHSVILALAFNKPVYPIVYNCKTYHYLTDLNFTGRYAMLNDLPNVTIDDAIYNYDHNIITDCSAHKKYTENQFWGLRQYLNSKNE